MDELELSGRRHISAKRAAREHRYHSDYIGQLIRSGKVAGQKVGRSWYVDAGSLGTYLQGAEQTQAPTPAPKPVQQAASPAPTPAPKSEEEVVSTPAPVAPPLQQEEPVRVVPIVRVEPQPVYVKPVHTAPVQTSAPAQAGISVPLPAPYGLRFVPDEEPLAPVRTMRDAMPEVQEEEVLYVVPARRRSSGTAGIVALGLCTFVFALALSYALVHKTTVTGEQASAAVSVSFER